jgi:hypothetical protein
MISTLEFHSPKPNYKYLLRYINYIERCKTLNNIGYCEKHHIIPKSFGGENTSVNIVTLSAAQHFGAHILLAKATGSPKMIKALHKMMHSRSGDVKRDYHISAKLFSYLREEHSKIVSEYSKNTVTAKHLPTGEVKRVPKVLFDLHNGEIYEAVSKGRKDTEEQRLRKSIAAQKPRTVRKGLRSRKVAATKYSYNTPKGYCETRDDVLVLYNTFTSSTFEILKDDLVISQKFASVHPEFQAHIGKTLGDIGFSRIIRK